MRAGRLALLYGHAHVRHIVAAAASDQSWLQEHGNLFTALGTLLAGALIVFLMDRFLVRRATKLAEMVTGDKGLSRDTATRLRFARRAIEAVIAIIVIAIALSEFDSLDRVGRTILASSAITAAVVGFAARQTLANAIAGILLAIVQPIRIGDLVTFEDETGTVEDVGLTYTWLRTGADARLLVPNERLAGGIIRNDSIRSPTVAIEVSVWLAARRRRGPRAGGPARASMASAPASRSPRTTGSASWSWASRAHRQSASPARPTCAPRRSAPCAARASADTWDRRPAEGSRGRARIHLSRAPGRSAVLPTSARPSPCPAANDSDAGVATRAARPAHSSSPSAC